jgi:hypothetical protein
MVGIYRAMATHRAELIERYAVRLLDEPHNEAMRAEMRVHIVARDALRQQADACDPSALWVRPHTRAWLD